MTHKKPSVSKLLDLLNKPALMYWANNLGLEGMSLKKYRKRRLSLGTSLHKQVEYFLVDGLIPDNELLKNNFIDFFTDIEVLGVEQKVENVVIEKAANKAAEKALNANPRPRSQER